MNADQELRYYLEFLLEHECPPGPESCPACRSLQRIFQSMQAEMFATVIYPEAAMEPRHYASGEAQPARGATR